jgi:flagellar hook-associated protein 2
MDSLLSPLDSISRTLAIYWDPSSSATNNITINASSPGDAAAQLDALNGLYARAYQMMSLADQLSGVPGQVNFSQSPTQSSDRDVVNIAYFDKSHYPVQVPESQFQFQVQQLAQNQLNQGSSLNAADAAAVNTGANTFTLAVGGTAYNLEVTINASDTNATALSKIAQAIDAANTGVTSAIVRGDNTIQLNLSGQSGEAQAFSLADLSGNAVSATGINNSTQTAADAKFLMNGTVSIQADNAVSLLDGHLQVNLTGLGAAAVTTGPQVAVDLTQSLTGSMNSFGAYLAGNPYLTPALSSAWSGLVQQEVGILSNYGLERGSQGQVGLDTLKFTEALQQNTAGTATAIGGLASRLQKFVQGLTSFSAGSLVSSSPTASAHTVYFSSTAYLPWWQGGIGGFSVTV